jgi:hypothetical protein
MKMAISALIFTVSSQVYAGSVSVSKLPQPILSALASYQTGNSDQCEAPSDMDTLGLNAQVEDIGHHNTLYVVPCATGAHNTLYKIFSTNSDLSGVTQLILADWSQTANGLIGTGGLLGGVTFNPTTKVLRAEAVGGGLAVNTYQIVSSDFEVASKLLQVTVQETGKPARTVFSANK